jgi:hypothetical protein
MTTLFSPVDTAVIANVNNVKYTFLLQTVYSKVKCYLQFALVSDPGVLPVLNWHSLTRLERVKIILFVSFWSPATDQLRGLIYPNNDRRISWDTLTCKHFPTSCNISVNIQTSPNQNAKCIPSLHTLLKLTEIHFLWSPYWLSDQHTETDISNYETP